MQRLIAIIIMFGIITTPILSSAQGETGSINLTPPDLKSGAPLMEALKNRSSYRKFSDKDLPTQVLSDLLWSASGINREGAGLLTAPTAKNAQEIDIYVALKSGLYIYNRKNHSLDLVLNKDIREFTGLQGFTQDAPVNLIYVSTLNKLGSDKESSMFYSAADTGFISQNVYLYAASKGLATVVLGWVDKDNLKKIMGLKEDQVVILTQPVGYPG